MSFRAARASTGNGHRERRWRDPFARCGPVSRIPGPGLRAVIAGRRPPLIQEERQATTTDNDDRAAGTADYRMPAQGGWRLILEGPSGRSGI
eukprot:2067071-Heterocapsa_arctica.AAC.1